MLFPQNFSGFVRLSASGSVSDVGAPILVSGYSVLSAGGGVGTPTIINGQSTSGATFVVADPSNGAASKERTIALPCPVMLPLGCYVSFDANTTAVTVFYTLAS